MQALKFRARDSIRRDSLPAEQLSYNVLLATFQELYGHPLHHHETLRYLDDQSEWIDISSDRELREALRLNHNKVLELMTVQNDHTTQFHQKWREGADRRQDSLNERRHGWRRPFENHANRRERVHRQENDNAKATEHPFDRRFNGPFRHPANCDNCHTQIVGDRYKCNDCLDYDLCINCIGFSSGIHPGHTFTTLQRSYRRWHHRQTDRSETKLDATDAEQPRHTDTTTCRQKDAAPIENKDEEDTRQNKPQHEQAEPRQEESKQQPEPVKSTLNASIITSALQTLAAMGFQDKAKNVGLLMTCGGNLEQVTAKLLDEQRL